MWLTSKWMDESKKFKPAFLRSLMRVNSCTDLGGKITFRHKLEPQWKCCTSVALLPSCVDCVRQWVIICIFVYDLVTSEIPLNSQRRTPVQNNPLFRWAVGISQCSCSDCCFLQRKAVLIKAIYVFIMYKVNELFLVFCPFCFYTCWRKAGPWRAMIINPWHGSNALFVFAQNLIIWWIASIV